MLFQIEENILLNHADRKIVSDLIDSAIQKPQEPQMPKEHWLKRNSWWIGMIVGPSVTVAVMLFMFQLLNTALDSRIDYRVSSSFDKVNNKLDSINNSLQGIRERLAIVETKANLFEVSFKKIADADQDSFSKALPLLRGAMGDPAASANDRRVMEKIAAKLNDAPETSPEYWPTVLRFIQFASSVASPYAPPKGTGIDFTIKDSRLEGGLISIPTDHRVFKLEGGEIANMTFRNARIIFTENPVQLRNVRFIDCVFEMPDIESPNPYLKKAAKELLASSFTGIKNAG